MVESKLKFGAATTITMPSFSSISNGAMIQSSAVSNTSNLFVDALVRGHFATPNVGFLTQGQVIYYAWGSIDSTIRSGNAVGSPGAYTNFFGKKNLKLLGIVSIDSTPVQLYEFGPWSMASVFGGWLPSSWGIVMENLIGTSLATNNNFGIGYQGVYLTSSL